MSELKAYKAYNRWIDEEMPTPNDDLICNEVYLKSEADKVIAEKDKKIDLYKRGFEENDKINAYLYAQLRHHKYKRCLAMAQEWRSYAAFCGIQSSWLNNRGFGKTAEKWTWKECHAWRCVKRCLELAEKFKEAK